MLVLLGMHSSKFACEHFIICLFDLISWHWISQDKNEIFYRPVTRAEAPDYFDIVKNPMSFMGIEAKLNKGEYLDFDSFKVC